MSTLGYLVDKKPALRLRYVVPSQAGRHEQQRVTSVTPLEPGAQVDVRPGTLVLVDVPASALSRQATAQLTTLVARLAAIRDTALALRVPEKIVPDIPDQLCRQAERVAVPLLSSSAPLRAWDGINGDLSRQRALVAEEQTERLERLLALVPTRLGDTGAVRQIVDWLAIALDADVMVWSKSRGVVTASSDSARLRLAHLVIGEPAEDLAELGLVGIADARLVAVSPGDPEEAKLAVGARRPLDAAASSLIQHAARILGLCDRAARDQTGPVPRSVRHAAFQLLMRADVVMAQVVYQGATKTFLDTPAATVHVVDTGPHDREPTLRWCEHRLDKLALVTACPGKPKHILVLVPERSAEQAGRALRDMIAVRDGHLMGVGQPHPLEQTAVGYGEALNSVRKAPRSADRICVGGSDAKLAPLLPRRAAQAWARDLVGPLFAPPSGKREAEERAYLLETVPIALSFKGTEAAAALGVHRNTVAQRLSRAEQLLSLDLRTSINNRILVLLALELLALPAEDADAPDAARRPGGPAGPGEPVAFEDLLGNASAAAMFREWAEERLTPVRADQRDLTETLRVWLECNLSTKETARALGAGITTVRQHTRDAALQLGMDFAPAPRGMHDADVATVADIGLALHILYGRPHLHQPTRVDGPAAG
ncbi:helix-turn-helix domain-containing protein [Actinacidiphila acidipaludis]|uniref:Helix-turn-helix domain-containing protein n=1 Tax=Actinacidiphila acidipaludis TaxID=2873382 RepID=A0ABS7QCH0_9ACTN|nr:helix-turn-helix domain-containing protein [Streptomyces acidipaludis]MBY8880868.1 helix-turn-helix domain-containing protein [Streptomyces acidipaludis]